MQHQILPEPEEAIRARAYQYWLDEGCPDGRHEVHWQRAIASCTIDASGMRPQAPAGQAGSLASDLPSDVSLVAGIGPRFKALLAEQGIHTLSELASMTAAQMAQLDARLGLNGRSEREDWLSQARELLAGALPRAKVDRSRA
jgi:large subunit ribosomal protein L21